MLFMMFYAKNFNSTSTVIILTYSYRSLFSLFENQTQPFILMNIIEKSVHIAASRKNVFEALTQTRWICVWTGDVAEMDLSTGGHFSLWGGSIIGINRLVTEEKIEQDWKEEQWPKFSKVLLTLDEDEDGFTILSLQHKGFPEKSEQAIDLAWDNYYLGPLKTLCENEFHYDADYNEDDE